MVGRKNSANVHAWVEERLAEYLDDRLAAAERARIEQHVRGCAPCRASLASLRWTIALVKQAPAPALPRAFTLPVPADAPRAARPSFAFGFAQFAAALATLLFLAVVGVDLLTQYGGGMAAPAPSAAKEYAAPTLAVAAAPPTVARDQVVATAPAQAAEAPKPTSAPKPAEPTQPPAPTAAPLPTAAPPAAALPAPTSGLPTTTVPRPVTISTPETPEPKSADTTEKARSATPAFRAGFAVTATATPAPTLTATSVPPTATPLPSPTAALQARAETAHAPQPTQVPLTPAQPLVTPVRAVELGLLLLAVLSSVTVIIMWRRR
jgi:anti-sigma factor RsiW